MSTSDLKAKLTKSLDFLKSELMQIRTGRANPALLEDIEVEAYGAKMKIKELATITLLDNQTLLVSPWDKSLVSSISQAIREGEQKLNPNDDGSTIKVPLPPLTEERRTELTKIVSQKVEEYKIAMRNLRQDEMKAVERLFSEKQIGEDEKFRQKDEIEKIVKDFGLHADQLGEEKKKDLMTI